MFDYLKSHYYTWCRVNKIELKDNMICVDYYDDWWCARGYERITPNEALRRYAYNEVRD